MTKSKRIEVTERITLNINLESLKSIVNQFNELLEEYPTARLEIDTFMDYDYPTSEVYVTWIRPETDEEYQNRLDRDKQAKEYRRKQYENLKKEFEKE